MAGRRRCGMFYPHFCLLVAFLSSFSVDCLATDTVSQGESIVDGQTLISAGQVFELGFFSPKGSTSRYVGIWYKNITVQTVVWVANRDKPLANTSGKLAIDSKGSLAILDGNGTAVTVLWQAPAAGTSSTNATLQDSGNLVRTGGSWQSFGYPTDTWLPGMDLGTEDSLIRLLTSWRSSTDPSSGGFTFQLDETGLSVLQNSIGTVRWHSGDLFSPAARPERWILSKSYHTIVSFRHIIGAGTTRNIIAYEASDPLTRFVMEEDGLVRLWARSFQSSNWTLLWGEPAAKGGTCGVPNYCGPNGLCNSATTPPCKCLPGFDPDSSSDWATGDWSLGCKRRTDVCPSSDRDVFLMLQGVKQPPALDSNYRGNSNDSIQGCKDQCLANCSCTAYALAYGEIPGCFMWFGDLMGLQGTHILGGAELYVRLAASADIDVPSSKKPGGGRKRQLMIALPVVLVTILLCGVGLRCFFLRKRAGAGEHGEELSLRDIGMDGSVSYKFVDVNKVGGERGPEIYVYGFSSVLEATNNFSDDNKLGQGGFGPVYKGRLPDGQEIAIKRLSTRSGQGLAEFKTEILLIARLQHKNLVRLLGCCIHGEERLLIYEYMPNKSLDFFLFDPERGAQLDWGKRIRIIEGITQGLLYLHKYSRLTIIHRDLKAGNILLDDEMNPKISDFGIARIFSSNEGQANTNRIVGTYGYMSPEYAMEGLFSVKSDVFSFGVLLLEIVSGRKSVGSHHRLPIPRSLLGYAWELWNAGKELELTDPMLGGSWPGREVSRCIYVGLMCVQDCAEDRPTMAEVVTMLVSDSSAHQAPKQPAYLTGRPTAHENCSPNSAATCSINDATISEIDGR